MTTVRITNGDRRVAYSVQPSLQQRQVLARQRQRQRQKRRAQKNRINALVIILLIASVLALVVNLFGDKPENQDFTGYKTIGCVVSNGNLIVLNGRPNVRSEPLAATYKNTVYAGTPAGAAGFGIETRGVKTSYGRIKDSDGDGTIFRVNYVLRCDIDPWNGPFYGIYLEDLSEAELKLLPRNVLKDPDGIVWISGQYLSRDNIKVIS